MGFVFKWDQEEITCGPGLFASVILHKDLGHRIGKYYSMRIHFPNLLRLFRALELSYTRTQGIGRSATLVPGIAARERFRPVRAV